MGKAIVRLDLALLHQMLNLPKDCQMIAASPCLHQKALELLVESAVLPEGDKGECYPLASVFYTVDFHPEDRDYQKVSTRVEVEMSPEEK